MFRLNTSQFTKHKDRVQTLIIGRLLVIFLLLIFGWFWQNGRLSLSFETFPQDLFTVFLISVGLTIAYFFLLRLNRNLTRQLRIQFFLDALLITWLIWRSGNINSPFIPLYIGLIMVTSIFLPSRQTMMFAGICSVMITLLVIAVMNGWISPDGVMPRMTDVIQSVGINIIAFLVVGFLASRLTERRISSERLIEAKRSLADLRVLHERIIESIRSGLITTDLDGKIFIFNSAASEITRYKASEMIGKSVFELLGPIQVPIEKSIHATDTGDQPLRFESDLITPEGFSVRIGYGISPLYSEVGEKTGLIITFQDLTEIRSMEENVRRKDRLAAVGRVAAGLAHEIRNPLGAMRGAIQVLESSMPPESTQSSLMEIILRESDRLNKIITNFLSYARPRATNLSEVDVRESINDTFTLLRHSPDVKDNHFLEADLPDRPVIISADPTQLKQIFWNLARNAIHAMPRGGFLRVKLDPSIPERTKIIFSDTGCGMSAAQVERLFEPFTDSTTGGTGLGMSIVYQIVRDHNGTINVRSLINEGTIITLEFPNKQKASANSKDKSGSDSPAQTLPIEKSEA